MRPSVLAPAIALAAVMAASVVAAQTSVPTPAREGIPQAPFAAGVLDRDFAQLLTWFDGDFDNAEQVLFADELGYAKDAVPQRIHSTFKPVRLPAFGDHVFYVQQYADNDPKRIYRQRIYSFSIDKAEGAIRLDIYTPKNAAALVDAHLDQTKLAALTKADVEARPGCEVFWRRNANQFTGYMKPGACRYASKQSGKTIVITDNLLLSQDEIWIADQAVDDKGVYVFGDKAGIPSKLHRARNWTCWMAVPHADAPDKWFFAKGLQLSDQGGEAWVTTDEATPRTFGYRLRQVSWPTGSNADALTLYVFRKGEDKAASYSWADPDAKRIGINLRWMQGSCSR